jgi:phosphonate transport system ATP-binding protein
LVNIHDVALAQNHADRIIGLSGGVVVFDGPPRAVTSQVLTDIYGEEDWSTTIRKVDEEEDQGSPHRLEGESAAG